MTEMPQELQEQIKLEDAIIEVLSSLWNMYERLPELHPLDKGTFQVALHKAQAIVLARPKIRGILMARQGLPSQEAQAPSAAPVQQLVTQPLAVQPAAPLTSVPDDVRPTVFPSISPG